MYLFAGGSLLTIRDDPKFLHAGIAYLWNTVIPEPYSETVPYLPVLYGFQSGIFYGDGDFGIYVAFRIGGGFTVPERYRYGPGRMN